LQRRRIVIDADISWKLARELRRRARADATALREIGLDELKDGAVLKALAANFEPCVLVTFDNKMPKAHAKELRHHGSTLAVVNRAGLAAWDGTEDSYIRDVVHRWAHRMELQEGPSVALYTSNAGPRRA
jgi:predicted nuclease of predicted toxin-antitoxin system